jgi:glycine/D-amino acid oxidase-like deaminating enzyme
MRNGDLSYWLSDPALVRPVTQQLTETVSADVAIVGGGLSGLWTAWWLSQQRPQPSVVVVEAQDLGHGASGRNGGWLSAKPVGSRPVLAKTSGHDAVVRVESLLREATGEIVGILGVDEIDARRSGWIQMARTGSEVRRIEETLATSRSWGVTDSSLQFLSSDEARERVRVNGVRAALFSPDCYMVNPAKMVMRLAQLVSDAGVRVYTHSRVDSIGAGHIAVGEHRVIAPSIVVATEGYTTTLPGRRRHLLPLNSTMLVTNPLTVEEWSAVGWDGHEGLSGSAHTYFYGQRTIDGRIAIGGRGNPYQYGSARDEDGAVSERTIAELQRVLQDLFPQVATSAAHAWCGALGVSRDWSPFVDYSPDTQVLQMGGYVGQGLTAAYLAGRIAADIVVGRRTEFVSLPWVRRRPRNWEPEPLRWLGAKSLYAAYQFADWQEGRRTSPATSRVAKMANAVAGR